LKSRHVRFRQLLFSSPSSRPLSPGLFSFFFGSLLVGVFFFLHSRWYFQACPSLHVSAFSGFKLFVKFRLVSRVLTPQKPFLSFRYRLSGRLTFFACFTLPGVGAVFHHFLFQGCSFSDFILPFLPFQTDSSFFLEYRWSGRFHWFLDFLLRFPLGGAGVLSPGFF